ncbi:MAG: hypothetical protein RJA70_1650 [Pseudomonadota bacterium]|jgi:DNA polymerase III delta prime subunit
MAESSFKDLIQRANDLAKRRGEILALAHLYCTVLADIDDAPCRDAREYIEQKILLQLDRAKRGYGPAEEVATFAWEDARRSFSQYSSATPTPDTSLARQVLAWLLHVGFQDTTQKWCLEACRRCGLVVDQQDAGSSVIPELGFGERFDARTTGSDVMFGRKAELAKHLGFLSLALQQRAHYLLVGKPGVGKSFFIRRLLSRACTDPGSLGQTSARSFVLFGRNDFLGSESENKERFGRLYSYLQQNPEVVPVFDQLEHVLRHAPNLAQHFAGMFGSVLAGGGRTFVLACESSIASSTPLLNGVRPCPLPPLTSADTRRLLLDKLLPELCQKYDLAMHPSAEELADSLLNMGPMRYPGRFLPELAIHLAESTAARAKNRTTFLQQAPLGVAHSGDLWGHIVDEQGLSPELFGKDPAEFYQSLRDRLTKRVIGQDHAVNQIASVLEAQAKRPPQRAPRGRFMFVGPPGVGKTELARSLAKELGYGEEAFFVFNMSEYSSDSARTRFMGADPGYVGFSATRTIYQCVRERPACVILLDEIDRADASIQDILLSIMEGEGKDAEGQPVYFSQVVFVMTTNLGQEAVQSAYEQVVSGQLTREALFERFGDEQLRRLVLEGATDDAEVGMQQMVDQMIDGAKAQFERAKAADPSNGTEALQLIDRYASLKELRARLSRTVRTSPLDRALMDRVDFIIPFFPIKERPLLSRILDLKLDAFGWKNCPESTKAEILDLADKQKESVRPLERLVKKYLCGESS